jgi:hypothetical protein
MNKLDFSESHIVKGLDAVADAFSGTVYSDVVSLRGHDEVDFILHKGVGATGTSTLTVEACDDIVPTTVSAVAFHYQKATGADDVPSEPVAATSTGFATTAGSSQLYRIKVDARKLLAAGYGFARLKCVEVVDSPVLGGILIELKHPRYHDQVPASVVV